jgi:hypothetical protein
MPRKRACLATKLVWRAFGSTSESVPPTICFTRPSCRSMQGLKALRRRVDVIGKRVCRISRVTLWSRGESALDCGARVLLSCHSLGLAIPTMWSRARTAWGAFGKQYPAGRRTVSSLVWLPTAVVFTQYFYSVKLVSGRSMQVRYTHVFMLGSLKVSQAAHSEPTVERMAGPGRVRPCLYLQ